MWNTRQMHQLKSVKNLWSPGLQKIFENLKQKHNSNCSGRFINKNNMNIQRKFENCWNFGCFKGVENWISLPIDLLFSKFQMWSLELPAFEKFKCVQHRPHFMGKAQTIKGTPLSFSLITERINTSEYVIELLCFWRTSDSHYSLSS